MQLHLFDQCRVDDGWSERGVVQERNTNAVEKYAHVAWWSAAHKEEGNAGKNRGDAWRDFDGTEGVAKGAGDLASLRARHDPGGVGRAHCFDDDLERLPWRGFGLRLLRLIQGIVGRGFRRFNRCVRSRGGRRFSGLLGFESNQEAYLGCGYVTACSRRLEQKVR